MMNGIDRRLFSTAIRSRQRRRIGFQCEKSIRSFSLHTALHLSVPLLTRIRLTTYACIYFSNPTFVLCQERNFPFGVPRRTDSGNFPPSSV